MVLIGVGLEDTAEDVEKLANKIVKTKLWPSVDGAQQWKQSVTDVKGDVLCVSQFTLFAKIKKGQKPDFHNAAKGPEAKELYDQVLAKIQAGLPEGNHVKDGVFGAMMDVALVNDGPVTIQYDTKNDK